MLSPRRPVATAAAVAVATMVVCDDAIVNCVDVVLGCEKEKVEKADKVNLQKRAVGGVARRNVGDDDVGRVGDRRFSTNALPMSSGWILRWNPSFGNVPS